MIWKKDFQIEDMNGFRNESIVGHLDNPRDA